MVFVCVSGVFCQSRNSRKLELWFAKTAKDDGGSLVVLSLSRVMTPFLK